MKKLLFVMSVAVVFLFAKENAQNKGTSVSNAEGVSEFVSNDEFWCWQHSEDCKKCKAGEKTGDTCAQCTYRNCSPS